MVPPTFNHHTGLANHYIFLHVPCLVFASREHIGIITITLVGVHNIGGGG